jgi:hypothetical protein
MTVEIERFTDDDKIRARELQKHIDKTLSLIEDGHKEYIQGIARLGTYLLEVRSKKFWLLWVSEEGEPHSSFGGYLKSIQNRVDKGRTQLYQTISVAERLLPQVSENDIELMGITKASVLAQRVKQTGKLTPRLIATATDPHVTIEELRGEVLAGKEPVAADKEKYHDLGGFYATDDEWTEVQRGFEIARRSDPPVQPNWPESVQKKVIILKLVQEFLAGHEAEVVGQR